MGSPSPRSVTLDAGGLIAFDRGDARARALMRLALEAGADLHVPAGALAQAWRDGRTQARLATLLHDDRVRVAVLNEGMARAVGVLLRQRGGSDVFDASVVVCARMYQSVVVTSDPEDIARLDPSLPLERI